MAANNDRPCAGRGATGIESWILQECDPRPSSSAELLYEGMESQSDRKLAVIYESLDRARTGHWIDTAITSAFAEALRGARTVLDIGPGDGWPSLRIADRFERIVGIDPSPTRVRVQRENAERLGIANVEFLEMDAVAMTFENESFDGVVAASSIEQTAEPGHALAEVFRVLRPGGAFAMIFEDYDECLAGTDGDERLSIENRGSPSPSIRYVVRTRTPPRERHYVLSLEPTKLDPEWPEEDGLALLEAVASAITETRVFELRHFTSGTVRAGLEDVGFERVRFLDHRFHALRAAVSAAIETERIDALAAAFPEAAGLVGAAAVRAAGAGPGDFVLASKPR